MNPKKPIAHDLVMDAGIRVKNLDELRSQADYTLLEHYRTKRLESFLASRRHDELVAKIQSIQATDEILILTSICSVLDIEKTIACPHVLYGEKKPSTLTEEQSTDLQEKHKMNSNFDDESGYLYRDYYSGKFVYKPGENKQMKSASARYNVVIVGQTGVGKSEFINYLYGQKIVETGVGKPVTRNGFHPIDFTINNLPVRIFDSWGIEVATYSQWMEELEEELKGRGLDESADKWFHSVYYCINANGSRIQDSDATIIKKFRENAYSVNIILTKADSLSDDDVEQFSKAIKKDVGEIAIIPVCSVAKIGRGGTIQPFGKEEVEMQAYKDFYASLIKRLPERCGLMVEKMVKDFADDQRRYVDQEHGIIGKSEEEIATHIEGRLKDFIISLSPRIGDEIKTTLEMYNQFCEFMHYPPSSSDEFFNGVGYKKRRSYSYFEDFDNVYDFGDFVNNVGTFLLNGPRAAYRFATGYVRDDEKYELKRGINVAEEELLSRLPSIKKGIKDHLVSLQEKAKAQGTPNGN